LQALALAPTPDTIRHYCLTALTLLDEQIRTLDLTALRDANNRFPLGRAVVSQTGHPKGGPTDRTAATGVQPRGDEWRRPSLRVASSCSGFRHQSPPPDQRAIEEPIVFLAHHYGIRVAQSQPDAETLDA
jgi:hypothetical protein